MPSSTGHSGYNTPTTAAPAASTQFLMASSGLSSANSSTKDVNASSLSVNYLPQKFSGLRQRGLARGGGREAFGAGAARMAGPDDDDGVGWLGADKGKRKRRWNKFKWILFLSNIIVSDFPCMNGCQYRLVLVVETPTRDWDCTPGG